MTRLEAALLEIASFLDEQKIPYAVIGGYANLEWGKPRLTQDVDLSVGLGIDALPHFVVALAREFELLPSDPIQFVVETRVLPVQTRSRVRLDLLIAEHEFEHAVIRRAVEVSIGGRAVRYCTAEDLILLKIISERPKDRDDIEGIVTRQAAALDLDYLLPRVNELARGLERPDIEDMLRALLRRSGREG